MVIYDTFQLYGMFYLLCCDVTKDLKTIETGIILIKMRCLKFNIFVIFWDILILFSDFCYLVP